MASLNKKKILLIILFVIVGFRAAFRSSTIGNDTYMYIKIFSVCQRLTSINDALNSELRFTVELGYMFLNWFCSRIYPHYQTILIVSSIIIYVGFYRFIVKYSNAFLLSFVLFFCLRFSDDAMCIIRQSIALAIILKSYDYIKYREFKKYLVCFVIAFLVHKSSIAFFPAWWICKMNLTKSTMLLLLSGSIIVMFAVMVGNQYVFMLMGDYYTYMSTDYNYVASSKIAPMINLLMYSLMLLFCRNKYKKIQKNSNNLEFLNDMNRMQSLVFVGVCIMLISLANALIFRIACYYYVFIIVLLPNSLKMSKERRKWTVLISTILLVYYIVTNIYRPEWNNVYPYSFFWEETTRVI